MDSELEALIVQLQKNNETADTTNSAIEALIKQNENLNIQPELEALIQQGISLRSLLEKNSESLKNAIESIKFPEQKEVDLKCIEETNNLLKEILNESKKECKISVKLNLI